MSCVNFVIQGKAFASQENISVKTLLPHELDRLDSLYVAGEEVIELSDEVKLPGLFPEDVFADIKRFPGMRISCEYKTLSEIYEKSQLIAQTKSWIIVEGGPTAIVLRRRDFPLARLEIEEVNGKIVSSQIFQPGVTRFIDFKGKDFNQAVSELVEKLNSENIDFAGSIIYTNKAKTCGTFAFFEKAYPEVFYLVGNSGTDSEALVAFVVFDWLTDFEREKFLIEKRHGRGPRILQVLVTPKALAIKPSDLSLNPPPITRLTPDLLEKILDFTDDTRGLEGLYRSSRWGYHMLNTPSLKLKLISSFKLIKEDFYEQPVGTVFEAVDEKDETIRELVTPDLLGRFLDPSHARHLPFSIERAEFFSSPGDGLLLDSFLSLGSNVFWGEEDSREFYTGELFRRLFVSVAIIVKVDDGPELLDIQAIGQDKTNQKDDSFQARRGWGAPRNSDYFPWLDYLMCNEGELRAEGDRQLKTLIAGNTIEYSRRDEDTGVDQIVRIRLATLSEIENELEAEDD